MTRITAHHRRAGAAATMLATVLFAAAFVAPAGATSLNVTFTATSVNFGSAAVGGTGTGQVAVTNDATISLHLKSATVHGGDDADFAVQTAGCAGALAPGGTCDLAVTFSPSSPGLRAASLAVIMGVRDPGGTYVASALVQAGLSGHGKAPTVTLSGGDAGTVDLGSTSIVSATLTNTSSVDLALVRWSLEGVVGKDFAITAVTCVTPIQPDESCQIVVAFRPRVPGAVTATLNVGLRIIGSSPARTLSAQAAIAGTGVSASGSTPVIEMSSLDLGGVTVGTSASGDVAIVNTSSSAVDVQKILVGGTDASDFSLASTSCGADLPASAVCVAQITFTPSQPKLRSATLGVKVSYTSGSTTKVARYATTLSGLGVRPSASISASDFGAVTIGSSESGVVTISNTSLASAEFVKATLNGPHAPSWSVASTTCAGPVGPGGSCEVELTFAPHTAGNLSIAMAAAFSITVGKHTVHFAIKTTVAGTGVQPTFTVAVPSLGPTPAATPVTGAATITNTSDVALTYKGASFLGPHPEDFKITGTTCTAQLAPTGTCSLTVRFDPKQSGAGTRHALLVVALEIAGMNPVHTVKLATAISGSES